MRKLQDTSGAAEEFTSWLVKVTCEEMSEQRALFALGNDRRVGCGNSCRRLLPIKGLAACSTSSVPCAGAGEVGEGKFVPAKPSQAGSESAQMILLISLHWG